ncbi:YgcG family protein [Methylocapsa sp. S129]|uniref:TPM domain-containing protein n=1 Tax=Methylocapsa sp. S129 TaxID=1641869 RepID=UPI00131AC592|nr:TPM domain-containing protein [Methylocapsa sp. S129]
MTKAKRRTDDPSPADSKPASDVRKATRAKRPKSAKPKIVFGLVILIFVVAIVFVRYAKQRQEAYEVEHPTLAHYVMADSLLVGRSDEAAMEEQLEKLNKDGAAQMIVVVEGRLTSGAIAEDTLQIGRRYGIGHAGKNDGIVLLIAAQEKKARIEVGYGLEGVLTDAQSRLIIANDIEPYLAKDDVAGAARHGLDAILTLVHPAPFAQPVVEKSAVEKPGFGQSLGVLLFMLIPVLIGIGVIQTILLAIPATRKRIAASKRWGWFARMTILGGSSRDDERGSSSGSSSSGIGGGGSFGGGGANN